MKFCTYPSKNGSKGDGPNNNSPILLKNNPVIIIDPWLFTLSANQPHPGLEIPYNADSNKKRSPMFSGLKLNCN